MGKIKDKIDKLEIIVFVSGAAVMILELIGSRILAPYLGTSIFVWASLIGIVLSALTIGYYLGGYFSKNNPQLLFLASVLFIAGLFIFLIALIKDPALNLTARLGVKTGSVAATLILFAWPSLLLGLVSPYAVRLKVQNIEGSGKVAGNLYALSTIGSIFGTFLAGFYLVPTFSSRQILFGLSLVLILTSLLGGKKPIKTVSIALILSAWLANNLAPSGFVYEGDSAYNHIRVKDLISKVDQVKIRILYLATEPNSIIYKDSDNLFAGYHQLYLLDNLFKADIKKALTLGGGAYVAPRNFLARYPEAEMTVLEIDPKVTQVAKDYFKLKDYPRLKIIHEDGRVFLNGNREKFDVIYGDAFASYYSIPFQLTTKEAMAKIYQALEPDGVLVLNVVASLEGKKSMFFQAEYKTIKEYFPQIYVFPDHFYDGKNTGEQQNLILIAAKNPARLSKDDLLKNANANQKELLDHFWEKEIILDSKMKILTDDFAPVDYYISKLL